MRKPRYHAGRLNGRATDRPRGSSMDEVEHTYEAAGRICGVSGETIRHRAKRGKLRRGKPTNTGRPTVLLSEDDIRAITAGRPTSVQSVGSPPAQPSGETSIIKAMTAVLEQSNALRVALEGEATALRDALGRERVRVDQMQAEMAAARAAKEAAEGALKALQGRGLVSRLLNRSA